MPLPPFATAARLKTRLSPTAYDAIFDDDGNGVGDDAVAVQFIAEAQSRVEPFIRAIYNESLFPDVPPVLTTLTLDLAHGAACLRFPEYVRGDGKALIAGAMDLLHLLRDGKIRLDEGSTDEQEAIPANVHVYLKNGTADVDGGADDGVGSGTFKGGFADF